MNRNIETSDLWAAIRGCEMWSASAEELRAIHARHENSREFAGRVIAEAARQVMVARRIKLEG